MIDLLGKDGFDLLLACVLGEAENEPLFGKLAVSCVVRNRVNDIRWPDNYKDVLLQPYQFSCFLPDFLRVDIFKRQYNKSWWREAKFAAYGVYYDWIQDVTKGANHYYSINIDKIPKWAEGLHPVFRMGGHTFFRL